MKKILIFAILLFPVMAAAQVAEDHWKPLRAFLGEWAGTGEGEPGKGKYQRSYRFILDGKFIEVKNKSTYPKQPKNPKGEVHEDIGYISYDKLRKTFILRQFHKEGFVNQYRLESISEDGKKMVFISEAIENIPNGWRAKETYEIGENELTETFELAAQDQDFKVYTKAILKRKAKGGKRK